MHMWVYIYNIFVINKGTDTSKKPKTTGSWAKTNLREGGGGRLTTKLEFLYLYFFKPKSMKWTIQSKKTLESTVHICHTPRCLQFWFKKIFKAGHATM